MNKLALLAAASLIALSALNTPARSESISSKAYDIAKSQMGVEEIRGRRNNPTIVNYFKETDGISRSDKTAWCSAFANYVMRKAGVKGSGKVNARSWLNWGKKVTKPRRGDVVVFWRESRRSWKGHVAFYAYETKTHVYVLGGNQRSPQGGAVTITAYPKYRVLGYRRTA